MIIEIFPSFLFGLAPPFIRQHRPHRFFVRVSSVNEAVTVVMNSFLKVNVKFRFPSSKDNIPEI